ncbi:hypothetical protein Agub_g9304, partial [Astrephomene gubernaculifera]
MASRRDAASEVPEGSDRSALLQQYQQRLRDNDLMDVDLQHFDTLPLPQHEANHWVGPPPASLRSFHQQQQTVPLKPQKQISGSAAGPSHSSPAMTGPDPSSVDYCAHRSTPFGNGFPSPPGHSSPTLADPAHAQQGAQDEAAAPLLTAAGPASTMSYATEGVYGSEDSRAATAAPSGPLSDLNDGADTSSHEEELGPFASSTAADVITGSGTDRASHGEEQQQGREGPMGLGQAAAGEDASALLGREAASKRMQAPALAAAPQQQQQQQEEEDVLEALAPLDEPSLEPWQQQQQHHHHPQQQQQQQQEQDHTERERQEQQQPLHGAMIAAAPPASAAATTDSVPPASSSQQQQQRRHMRHHGAAAGTGNTASVRHAGSTTSLQGEEPWSRSTAAAAAAGACSEDSDVEEDSEGYDGGAGGGGGWLWINSDDEALSWEGVAPASAAAADGAMYDNGSERVRQRMQQSDGYGAGPSAGPSTRPAHPHTGSFEGLPHVPFGCQRLYGEQPPGFTRRAAAAAAAAAAGPSTSTGGYPSPPPLLPPSPGSASGAGPSAAGAGGARDPWGGPELVAEDLWSDDEEEREDTTAEQFYDPGQPKDIQGIPWDRLQFNRATYRETRLRQYRNYTNVLPDDDGGNYRKELAPLCTAPRRCGTAGVRCGGGGGAGAGAGSGAAAAPAAPPASMARGPPFFTFVRNSRAVQSNIVHFQLRNLVWAASRSDVYVVHDNCVNHWDPVAREVTEVLNLAGGWGRGGAEGGAGGGGGRLQALGRVQVSTMCVSGDLLAAGGFMGEMVVRRLAPAAGGGGGGGQGRGRQRGAAAAVPHGAGQG